MNKIDFYLNNINFINENKIKNYILNLELTSEEKQELLNKTFTYIIFLMETLVKCQ